MQIPIVEARDLAADVLSGHGMARDHAMVVADHLVDAAGAGHPFAGLPRVLAIIDVLARRPPEGPISVERRSPISAVVDGAGTNGYVTSLMAVDEAIDIARTARVALVSVRNSWFSGRLAYYVERAARAGFVAFHTANTQARVAPAGGIDRILGTNPLAFAFPAEPAPLVIDVGTSATTWGDVLLRQQLGEALDPGAAVDADGHPTTDPTAALLGAFLPWGGHRGSGIALVAQILGILSGSAPIVDDVASCGFFFLLFDPSLLMPMNEFQEKVAELVQRIESSRPAAGTPAVRVPGRGSEARRAASRSRGWIDVDTAVYATLVGLRGGPVR